MVNKLIKLIDDIEEGNVNPLDVYKYVKAEVDNINSLFESIKEMALIEADCWGKAELEQHGFQLRSGRNIYNYDEDKEYLQLKNRMKELEVKLKDKVSSKSTKSSLIITNK